MRRRWLAILVLSFFVWSCGGDDGPSNPGDGDDTPGGLTEAQAALVGAIFGAGFDGTEVTTESIDNVAGAVEVASIANGELTFTGTLTETGAGTGEFNWAAGPNDRMVVQFAGGPRFEVFIQAFEGFLDGDASDFVDFHSDFRFRIVSPNLVDIQVQSQSGSPGGPGRLSPASPAATVVFNRRTTGTVVSGDRTYTVDITNQGERFFEVDGNFSELDRTDILTGTIQFAGGTITLNEGSRSHLIFNAGEDRLVQNFFRENESSAVLGGETFQFSDFFIRREFVNGRISEVDFWVAQGALVRNGTAIGQIDWSFPPAEGSTGPTAVIRFERGEVLEL